MRHDELAASILPFPALLHVVLHDGLVDVAHEVTKSVRVAGKARDGDLAVAHELCLEVENYLGFWRGGCRARAAASAVAVDATLLTGHVFSPAVMVVW